MKRERICPECGRAFIYGYHSQTCCSIQCSSNYRKTKTAQSFLYKWLANDIDGISLKGKVSRGEINISAKNAIKNYLLEEQNHLCAICKCNDKWNDRPLTFILDHIDGDWRNHLKGNLRLICPNCNSQLETTKNNHGRGRYSGRHAYIKSLNTNG